jgi:ABC-2 type transport system permease protein
MLIAGLSFGATGMAIYGIAPTGLLFAAGVALRFRSLQATPLMQVPVFLFLFLAPVYVPRQLLGGWVHAVAPFNPVTHVMETARDLIAGTGTDYLATLGIVVALLAVVTLFMFRGLRQAEAAG